MALSSSGAISFRDIADEYGDGGGPNNIGLGSYYRGGFIVPPSGFQGGSGAEAAPPASGAISLNDFRGTRNVQHFEINDSSLINADLKFFVQYYTLYTDAGQPRTNYKNIGDVVVYNYNRILGTGPSDPALVISGFPRSVKIVNFGRIFGGGGDGGSNGTGQAGGIAIYTFNNITVENYGYVAGGGGGGGGGRCFYSNSPGYDAYIGGGGGAGGGEGGAGGNNGTLPGGSAGSVLGTTLGSNGFSFNSGGYSLFGRGGGMGGGGGSGTDLGRGAGPGGGTGGGSGFQVTSIGSNGGTGQYGAFGGFGSGNTSLSGGNGGSAALQVGAGGGGAWGTSGGTGYSRNEGSITARAGGSGGNATTSSSSVITWSVSGTRYGALL
jgi:hypothetical protein